MNKYKLNIGDHFDNGQSQILIVDEDRLCYLVKSVSKGAVGYRTISKLLLKEYVEYFLENPNASANDAREALSGTSNVDKFEYGYTSTLRLMALIAIKNHNKYIPSSKELSTPLQTIYYGTPGSGKSRKVKDIVKGVDEDFVFRTTFHPDSDYASFVGCYKPVMKSERNYMVKKTLDELKEEANDITSQPAGNKVSQVIKFVTKYATLFPKIVEDNDEVQSMQNLLNKHLGFSNETYLTYIIDYVIKNQKQDSKISYEFTPQTFTKAYVAAWNNPEQQIYLIIEEINRGNCAQIFGDLFQLLDRENGVSEYPIDADNDLKDYLEQELGAGHEGIKNGKLKLPSNLNILATMNTSDQSLFPMDSAFKRRWAWECVPVDYTNPDSGKFTIEIGGSKYKWHDFLFKANNKIKDLTFSEDKQMGNFFISSNVDKRQFIDKVMFYLWNDICKDEYGSGSFFRRYIDDNNPESEFSFNDLFGDDKKTEAVLNDFMKYLAVEKIEAATSTGEEQ